MSNHPFIFVEKETITSVPLSSVYRQTNESSSEVVGSFLIATTENNRFNLVHGLLTPQIKSWFYRFSVYEAKEGLYVTAIDNLLKKVEYLNLTMQLDQNLITEDEFDNELEKNEENYLIKINPKFKDIDIQLVQSITQRLKKRNFSSDDISEIFSIPVESIEEFIECNHEKILL